MTESEAVTKRTATIARVLMLALEKEEPKKEFHFSAAAFLLMALTEQYYGIKQREQVQALLQAFAAAGNATHGQA